jgi:hypothetical protein
MASKMANQVDVTPSTNPTLGIHLHVPAGASASGFNNMSDFPAVPAKSTSPSGGKAVQVTVAGVRFSNPS